MGAVAAAVEVCATGRTFVAEPDAFAARQLDDGAARRAVHRGRLRECGRDVNRNLPPSALARGGDSVVAMSNPSASLAALLLLLLALFALAPSPGAAQGPGGGGPDAVDLALAWSRGGYASPVVCRFGERAERGLRRVLIAKGPRTSEQRVNRVNFFDLDATGSTGCVDELGAEERNVIGAIYVTHKPRRPHSDTPERDMKQDIERGPIEYQIVSGRLRVGSAAMAADALREVDFGGGTLRIGMIEPGSDDARRIADLPGLRQLRLEVVAEDDTRVVVPLVEVERR